MDYTQNLNLPQFEETDRIHHDDFNTAFAAIDEAMARIVVGSYVGTGTYGTENPCSISFDFTPKILVFLTTNTFVYTFSGSGTSPSATVFHWGVTRRFYEGTWEVTGQNDVTYDGNTISWSNLYARSGSDQRNTSGTTYYYLAIG